jgi:hypothetical protein
VPVKKHENFIYHINTSPPVDLCYYFKPTKNIIMKQIILFLTSTFLLSFSSTAQLDKKTWLVGGSGSFKSLNNNFQSSNANWEYKITEIKLTPNIGYFVMDKFAVGLKSTLLMQNAKSISGAGTGKSLRLDYGPFVRYYFLEKDKQFNILTDITYQFGNVTLTGEKGMRNNFSFLAGPAIYFNSSVAAEFLIGYTYTKEQISSPTYGNPYKQIDKGFQFAIGLQIHLEKL